VLVDVPEWRFDVVEEHLEELESLWNRRLRAPRSADIEAVGLARLDRRIDAHTDALVLADEHAAPLVDDALAAEVPAIAAAAALVIASADAPAREQRLVDAFLAAPPPVRDAMRAALELRAPARLRAAIAASAQAAPAVIAASIATVFAAHGDPPPLAVRRHWLQAPEADVRRAAWIAEMRIAAGRPGRGAEMLEPAAHQGALTDGDREVRRLALETAARAGRPWLLDRLRATAAAPSARAIDEHLLLAMIGDAADAPRLVDIARSAEIGWYRYGVLALCGRAPAVEELLRTMREGAPVDGALAAAAFRRVTGIDVRRAERIPLVPPGNEADEISDEIKACDAARATRAWDAVRARMGAARWVYGEDPDALPVAALPATFDLEIRFAVHLRSAFTNPARPPRFDHETFPFDT
jgi:hypothetical protein